MESSGETAPKTDQEEGGPKQHSGAPQEILEVVGEAEECRARYHGRGDDE